MGAQAHPRRRPDLQGATRRCTPRRSTCSRRSRANDHYVPKVADPLAPETFVHKIDVPVYLACQWTDEQTGGHCPTLPRRFTGTQPQVVHVHQRHAHRRARPCHVHALVRLPRALRRAPPPAASHRAIRDAAPVIFKHRDGRAGRHAARRPDPGPADATPRRGRPSRRSRRCGSCSTTAPECDAGRARTRVRALVRALPAAGHARAVVVPRRRRGARRRQARRGGRRQVHLEPHRAAPDELHRQHLGRARTGCGPRRPRTAWSQHPAGTALSYVTAPLAADTGGGRRRRAGGVDPLAGPQRRPPGHGLRGPARRPGDVRAERLAADERAQARRAQEHAARAGPEPAAPGRAPLPKGRWAKVTVPLYYQGHVYRAGSRLRVTLAAPRGDQPVWASASSGRASRRVGDRCRARPRGRRG